MFFSIVQIMIVVGFCYLTFKTDLKINQGNLNEYNLLTFPSTLLLLAVIVLELINSTTYSFIMSFGVTWDVGRFRELLLIFLILSYALKGITFYLIEESTQQGIWSFRIASVLFLVIFFLYFSFKPLVILFNR